MNPVSMGWSKHIYITEQSRLRHRDTVYCRPNELYICVSLIPAVWIMRWSATSWCLHYEICSAVRCLHPCSCQQFSIRFAVFFTNAGIQMVTGGLHFLSLPKTHIFLVHMNSCAANYTQLFRLLSEKNSAWTFLAKNEQESFRELITTLYSMEVWSCPLMSSKW